MTDTPSRPTDSARPDGGPTDGAQSASEVAGAKQADAALPDAAPLDIEVVVARATAYADRLYAGVETPHRSCGIAIAETFGRDTRAYQALRRGGITGCGECGAIKAGELVLGELLGDPNPTGAVTPALRAAALRYREVWQSEVDTGAVTGSIVCNDLTGQFAEFTGAERHAFCTRLAASVAGSVARVLAEAGVEAQPE